MTVDAEWPLLPGSDDASDALSAWLIQHSAHSTDRGAERRELPAGPGLSALEMAAACLCLADATWHPIRQSAGS
jgi:hypothetical protein